MYFRLAYIKCWAIKLVNELEKEAGVVFQFNMYIYMKYCEGLGVMKGHCICSCSVDGNQA